MLVLAACALAVLSPLLAGRWPAALLLHRWRWPLLIWATLAIQVVVVEVPLPGGLAPVLHVVTYLVALGFAWATCSSSWASCSPPGPAPAIWTGTCRAEATARSTTTATPAPITARCPALRPPTRVVRKAHANPDTRKGSLVRSPYRPLRRHARGGFLDQGTRLWRVTRRSAQAARPEPGTAPLGWMR